MRLTASTRTLAAALLDPVRAAVERGLAGSSLALGEPDALGERAPVPAREPVWAAHASLRTREPHAPSVRTGERTVDASRPDAGRSRRDAVTRTPAPTGDATPSPSPGLASSTARPRFTAPDAPSQPQPAVPGDRSVGSQPGERGPRATSADPPQRTRPAAVHALPVDPDESSAVRTTSSANASVTPVHAPSSTNSSGTTPPARARRVDPPTTVHAHASSERRVDPSPTHPSTSERHADPSPTHPATSERHVGPSPTHTSTSEHHGDLSPTHPATSERHAGPSPMHAHPSTSERSTDPSPMHAHPSTSERSTDPSPMHAHPSTSEPLVDSSPMTMHPSTSERHAGPSPTHPATSERHADPSPMPAHPSTSEPLVDPSPMPTHPATSERSTDPSPAHRTTSERHADPSPLPTRPAPTPSGVPAASGSPLPTSPGVPVRSLAAPAPAEPPPLRRADAAVADQVTRAMRPVLDAAAAVTDAALHAPEAPRVANNFAVHVQLGGAVDPDALGAALVDMLREAARRHGLEV